MFVWDAGWISDLCYVLVISYRIAWIFVVWTRKTWNRESDWKRSRCLKAEARESSCADRILAVFRLWISGPLTPFPCSALYKNSINCAGKSYKFWWKSMANAVQWSFLFEPDDLLWAKGRNFDGISLTVFFPAVFPLYPHSYPHTLSPYYTALCHTPVGYKPAASSNRTRTLGTTN